MSVPRILLLTAHPPGSVGIGGLYLSTLCQVYPHHSICCFSISLPKVSASISGMAWMPMQICQLPRQAGVRRLGPIVEKLTRPFIQHAVRLLAFPALVKRAVEFGQAYHVDLVWAVL